MKNKPTVEKCHTCHKPLITDWHEGDCIKCARDKVLGESPTETVSEKKIWGSTCCNVGVMCRGIGKEHHHICNRCNKKCEVKYEDNS